MTSAVENIVSKKEKFLDAIQSSVVWTNESVNKITEESKLALQSLSFPTSRTEAWKYTRVGKIVNKEFASIKSDKTLDLANFDIPGLETTNMVFVNGFYREDLSQPFESEAIDVLPMQQAMEKNLPGFNANYGTVTDHKNQIFTAINACNFTSGLYVHAKKGKTEKPIHFIHFVDTENVVSQCKNLFVGETNSECNIIQSFHSISGDAVLTNEVTEVVVSANAHLTINKIQKEADSAFHISNEFVRQDQDSTFDINTFSLTGGWIRNNLDIYSKGKATMTNLYGLYHPKTKEHVDNHTLVDHCEPDGESNELYKGLIYEKGTGVFNGKVIVEPHAQRTNAYQQNANILMHDDANVNSKPELEIYADDVKCSHGSTTGQFDEEALFYLMARGIDRTKAKRLLTEAFLSEVVDQCDIPELRELVFKSI